MRIPSSLITPALFTLTSLFLLSGCGEYDEAYHQEIEAFQTEWNDFFGDSIKSPLTKEDYPGFEELDYFPVNKEYRVEAEFIRTPDEEPFEMPTTTDRRPVYLKYGEAKFEMKGEKVQLDLFQSQKYAKSPSYDGHLFLPFSDLTSGKESYGGGRFIDLKIPPGDTIVIDFNKAYNPYCAYNPKYSCPIPPPQNHINLEIRAGVKAYH